MQWSLSNAIATAQMLAWSVFSLWVYYNQLSVAFCVTINENNAVFDSKVQHQVQTLPEVNCVFLSYVVLCCTRGTAAAMHNQGKSVYLNQQ